MNIPQNLGKTNRAVVVASELCRLECQRGSVPTTRRIELLAYFASTSHDAIYGEPLIYEEVYADAEGPMIKSIRNLHDGRGSGQASTNSASYAILQELAEHELRTVVTISNAFKKISDAQLEMMAKVNGGAWAIARVGIQPNAKSIIFKETMRKSFYVLASEQIAALS